MRPDELRGSAGTQRLREELMARANIAVAPPAGSTQPAPRITDVLFTEILVQ
jgi:flagellar FliL protein